MMRWRLEKTGNIVNGVAPNSPVRLLIDGAVPQATAIDLYQIPERLLRSVLVTLGRKPARHVGSLALDVMGPGPIGAGICSERWEPAHLPPPELPTRYLARMSGASSPELSVGSAVQFTWDHHSGWHGDVSAAIPGSPVKAKAGRQTGSSLTLTGTAYCPADPEITIASLIPTLSVAEEGELVEFIFRSLRNTAEDMDLPDLQSAFNHRYGDYLSHVHLIHSAVPQAASIPEGGQVPIELHLSFSYPARSLAAVGAYGRDGKLLSISPIVALSYDGVSTTIEC